MNNNMIRTSFAVEKLDMSKKRPEDCIIRRKKKPVIPRALGMTEFRPKEVYIIGTKRFIFSYSPTHLCLLAFYFAWIDLIVFTRFGFFCLFQTGNLIFLCILASPNGNNAFGVNQDYKLLIWMMVVNTVFGTLLNVSLLDYFRDRTQVYVILQTLACIMCSLTDFLTGSDKDENGQSSASPYAMIPLILILGALNHWTTKLGYTINFYTINIFKLAEASYAVKRGYSFGSAKLRGDYLSILLMLSAYITGLLGKLYHNS
jgi:uncharacterized membrane protein YoaK (UPF0700 family)